METFELVAENRPAGSKGDARKVRRAGGTPGVIYRAGEPAVPVRFDGAALSTIFRKTNNANTVINVVVGGKPNPCLVREVQRHPVSRVVEHVDFYRVEGAQEVRVTVPVVTAGKAAGVRAGGLLRLVTRRVSVLANADAIPAQIEVDVTDLEIGKFIRASQLVVPKGARVVFAQDFNVVTVEGKRTEAAPEAAAAAPVPGSASAKPAEKAKK